MFGKSVSSWLVGDGYLGMEGVGLGCKVMVEVSGVREDAEAMICCGWWLKRRHVAHRVDSRGELQTQVPSARSRRSLGRSL